MVAIRDASYMFQSLLVNGKILAYFSVFETIIPMKGVCPFNIGFSRNQFFMNIVYA